jgi:hypothetical protein
MSITDPRQPEQFSPTVRAVYDTLRRLTADDGTGPTHAIVASEIGASPITVRRAIDVLRDASLLKSDARYVNNRQVSNSYSFPTTTGDLMPAHSSTNYEQAIYVLSSSEAVDPDDLEDPDEDPEPMNLEPDLDTSSTVCTRVQSPALGFAQCTQDQEPRRLGESRAVSGISSDIFVKLHQVNELVDDFASRVDRVGPSRRRKFWNTAYGMLIEDGLAIDEVRDVVEHAFAHEHRLACELDVDEDVFLTSTGDIKLTRLDQIRVVYPEILADLQNEA